MHERHDRKERDISTITFSTTEKGFSKIKNLIGEFQNEVIKIVERHDDAERVYQPDVQLFPLSRTMKDK